MSNGWRTRTFHNGRYTLITEIIGDNKGTMRIEAWGNSKDGWFPHLVDTSTGIGIDIGPYFGYDLGDTLRDLKAAAGRAYSIDPKTVKTGRNFW